MKRKKSAPRNPLVAVALFKAAGAHGRSEKALRRAAKMQLQREYGVKAAQTIQQLVVHETNGEIL